MLTRRILSLRPLSRSFALSRFPDAHPVGSARAKKPAAPREQPKFATNTDHVSAEDSPLWQASQRPPSSDPEEGLERLLMDNKTLVVTRQLEMLNIFVGFEQANKYTISNEEGEALGFIAEEPRGFLSSISRQIFRTHRPFRAVIMDKHGTPVIWIRRPFSWINSRMFVQRLNDFNKYTSDGEPILDTFSEVQQRWHLWRRRYDLFLKDDPRRMLSIVGENQPEPDTDEFTQVARIDEGFWAWHFTLRDARGEGFAHINRAFRGLGREMFTDTGQYFVTFAPQAAELEPMPVPQTAIRNMTLQERALVLAMAVNIDFDYFSRHSEGGGGIGLGIFGIGAAME